MLILSAAAMYAGRRHLAHGLRAIRGCRTDIHTLWRSSHAAKGRNQPHLAPEGPCAVAPQGKELNLDPFDFTGIALTGSGAEGAVRHIALALLSERQKEPVEVVLSRADAHLLLGIGPDALAGEMIPGFVVADDAPQAYAYLRSPGPRRLCIIRDGDLELLRDLLLNRPGRIAAISLSPWQYESAEITSQGEVIGVSNPMIKPLIPSRLPLLGFSAAYLQIMAFPTVRRT